MAELYVLRELKPWNILTLYEITPIYLSGSPTDENFRKALNSRVKELVANWLNRKYEGHTMEWDGSLGQIYVRDCYQKWWSVDPRFDYPDLHWESTTYTDTYPIYRNEGLNMLGCQKCLLGVNPNKWNEHFDDHEVSG